ncbi:MAG: glycosyltransferase [Caldilineaceae bacterium]
MQILILTPQLPYPPQQGTTLRNFNIISNLAQRHTIDLITFLSPGQKLEDDSPLHQLCRRIDTVPQPVRTLSQRARDTLFSWLPDMGLRLESAEMHRLVRQRMQKTRYDIVQVEGIEMAQYGLGAHIKTPPKGHPVSTGIRTPRVSTGPKVIFDDHNCEYLLQQRNCLTDLRIPRRWIAALYSFVQWQKLRRYEAAICRRSDAVSAVSPADAEALHTLVPDVDFKVIPNGIDLEKFTPSATRTSETTPPKLIFVGKMDYRPNIDAVLWFGRDVFPLIRQQQPDVGFQIVGLNPHPRLDELRTIPGIEITGGVDDVRPLIQRAAVYVIPLRVGGGTRFKALEAMACGKPIVSTSLGVEGIGVKDGEQLLLADSALEFAAAVLTLLRDLQGQRTSALCQNARKFVESHYGWEQIVPKFDEMYAKVMGGVRGEG